MSIKSFDASTWNEIHSRARDAVKRGEKEEFIAYIRYLYENAPCEMCHEHMGLYVRQEPFKKYWKYRDETGLKCGMFRWSWDFHNNVNRRLGKPEVSWEDALRRYYPTYQPRSTVQGQNNHVDRPAKYKKPKNCDYKYECHNPCYKNGTRY